MNTPSDKHVRQVDDGFGNRWQCIHELGDNLCRMNVVRPGKVQCPCDGGVEGLMREIQLTEKLHERELAALRPPVAAPDSEALRIARDHAEWPELALSKRQTGIMARALLELSVEHSVAALWATRVKLTAAQRRVLTTLRDDEDRMLANPDKPLEDLADEIVCQGLECWMGLTRTNWRVVRGLLHILAISDRSDHGNGMGTDVQRFRINATGRIYLKDESQIDNVLNFMRQGKSFTHRDGKIVPL